MGAYIRNCSAGVGKDLRRVNAGTQHAIYEVLGIPANEGGVNRSRRQKISAREEIRKLFKIKMLIIPAIDIKDGCVVRFVQGHLDKKIYSHDPVKTARHWAKQGAKLIHVVDLDGAFSGKPKNLAMVRQIVKAVDVPVQFGGGIRNLRMIETLLNYGIWRIILGTKAAQDRGFLKKAFKKFKDKIIVSIDTKADRILTKGWESSCRNTDILKFAHHLKGTGFKQVIYTDVLKDGTLKGPNIKGIKNLLKETALSVIASGGISSLSDIRRLKLLEKKGLVGVIIGKAIYEGRFTLAEALKLP